MEATQMSIDRCMDNEDAVYILNEISLSHKREWNNALAVTWMDLEIVVLREVRHTEADKYQTIFPIGGIQKVSQHFCRFPSVIG